MMVDRPALLSARRFFPPPPPAPSSASRSRSPTTSAPWTGWTRWCARRERGYVCVAAVHTVMVCQEDPELRDAVLGSSLTVPDGQPLVWAMNALGHDLPARLRARADGALLRALRRDRRAHVPLRRAQPGRARAARAQPAPALPRPEDRRRLLAALPRPHRRGGGLRHHARSTPPAPTSSGSGIGVPKQEKWMAHMRDRLERAGARRRRRRLRLPRRPHPQAPDWMQRSGSSGCTAWPRSRGACGGATCATTRASSLGFLRQYRGPPRAAHRR